MKKMSRERQRARIREAFGKIPPAPRHMDDKYLKRLVERVACPGYTLCIIDEILKGTNTKERLAASEAVLDYMGNTGCLTIAATHDRELAATMEGAYDNYHFRNYMEEGEIRFDYRLHRGISDSSNAVALLEVLGFPKEIIREAALLLL
ncbi:MAG TPA: hypothetical protein DF613_02390 [Lachnospiraceae bacterium]|nr:hypothetical protein [Lachnospiraceae bacterium]